MPPSALIACRFRLIAFDPSCLASNASYTIISVSRHTLLTKPPTIPHVHSTKHKAK
jgi:hypothetical protein